MLIPSRAVAYALLALTGVSLVALLGLSWYHAHTRTLLVDDIERHVRSLRGEFSAIANATSRNGLDASGAVIVLDCEERNQYETLLNKLANLSRSELVAVERLFGKCGDHYALRKRLMAERLRSSDDSLEAALELLGGYRDIRRYDEVRVTWGSITEEEKNRGILLTEQVAIQRSIIEALLGGSRNGVPGYLEQAQEVAQRLEVSDKQLTSLRADEEKFWNALAGNL